MPAASPAGGDVISFTHERYPQQFLVGVVVAVRSSESQVDVDACLAAAADGSNVVAFTPSGSTSGPAPAEQVNELQKELDELRDRRDVLNQDVAASRARIGAIDRQIEALQATLKTAPPPDTSKAADPAPEVVKANKGLAEARKGLQSSLKSATADWTKLTTLGVPRTVDSASKPDRAAKIVKGPPPPKEAVELVEAALAILNSKSAGATFRGAQARLLEVAKKCSMLKPDHVDVAQLKKADTALSHYTTATLAKLSVPAALVPLYTWVKAMSACVKARQQQQQEPASEPRKSASPDPVKPPESKEDALRSPLEQLTQERKEHEDYVDLAEEELEAMAALVRETAAAVAAASSPSRLATQNRTLHVAMAQVVSVLPRDGRLALAMEKATLMAPGTPVLLPHQTIETIIGHTSTPEASASAPERSVQSTQPLVASPTASSQGFTLAPASQDKKANTSAAPGTPIDDGERTRLTARIQELETSLHQALYNNPTEAEVQLLREELKAKAADLERLTEERDRLLQEKRERPRGSSLLVPRARSEVDRGESATQISSVGRAALPDENDLDATVRPRVDRRVAEELEEQLRAAHQQIRLLEKQLSADAATATTTTAATPRRESDKTQGNAGSSRQLFSPVGMLSCTLPDKANTVENDALSLRSGATGEGENELVEESGKAGGDATSPRSAALVASSVSPPVRSSNSFISPDMQQQYEARLQTLSQELEQQRRQTMMAEERLNLALHTQQETQRLCDAQKKEMKTLWKRIEDAESLLEKERFQATIALRRQSILDEASYPSVSPSLPNVITIDELGSGIAPTCKNGPTTPTAQPGNNNSGRELGSGLMGRSSPSVEMPLSDPLHVSPSFSTASNVFDTSGRRFSAPPGRVMSVGRRDTRSMSAVGPLLSRAPEEQMTPVELRHEVRALRGEVERLQSVERRLSTELADMHAQQREERRQRRESRRARMNMMAMMESAVAAALAPADANNTEQLLTNARSETESIRSRHPSGQSFSSAPM